MPRASLLWRPQVIAFDNPHSNFMFRKPFTVTDGALQAFGPFVIADCLLCIQAKAETHQGLDHLQVFDHQDGGSNLYLIEDDEYVTALLPEEY